MSGAPSGSSDGGTPDSGDGGTADAADATPNDGGGTGDTGDATTVPNPCVTSATPASCAQPVDINVPVCKLSLTGCMNPANPTQFAAGAVYYEVNSPLWSDGAIKTRAFILPAGGKIHVRNCTVDAGAADLGTCTGISDTGKWVFPIGTVMIKNFLFGGKFVETRLLIRVDDATAQVQGSKWIGYSYAWNESQTEAMLNPNARTEVMFHTGTDAGVVDWHYPHRTDCFGCHNSSNGGDTLGPEMDQMNRVVAGTNQIDAFATMGLFDVNPAKPYPAPLATPYSGQAGLATGTVAERARSYLSANCGFCHRPDWNNLGFDLRYGIAGNAAGVCNVMASKPATGVTPGTTMLLAPGSHANSALWIRMNEQVVPGLDPQGSYRMPQIATYVVDSQGTIAVAQWIDSLTACP
jgi:hypothetical protein